MTIAVVRRQPSNTITMEGSASSSINSRATAIKTILLAAWRGKLTNEEWESRIRKVLPRGVSGDVYDLADCLLKQALIGPVPNQLFLNYLKHAVSCELVSHGAILRSISNQPINLKISSSLLQRTSPIICLLEFIKSFRDKISCKGTEVECLNLCRSLSELLHWLLRCLQQTLEFIITNPPANLNSQQTTSTNITNPSTGSGQSASGTSNNGHLLLGQQTGTNQIDTLMSIIDLCTETINYFVNRPFTKSLLFISKVEYFNDFEDNILKPAETLDHRLNSVPQLLFLKDRIQYINSVQQLSMTFSTRELHPSVVAAQQLRCLQEHRIRSTQINASSNFERNRLSPHMSVSQMHDSNINYTIFNSLYPLVAFDAILRPARLNKHLARQIVTIANFNSAPIHTTYCELIRVCMIGIIDAHGHHKAKEIWAFFTFLKLPRLLIELNQQFEQQSDKSLYNKQQALRVSDTNDSNGFTDDLKQAFERLCEYSPLLDEAESKINCDLFKCLIKELIKNDASLTQLKNMDFRKFSARRNGNLVGGHMMLKTEPIVTHMLSTLESQQDPIELYGVLCQSCSGISFEYTLSAAAATGRLHLFVKRLVEHNELYKLPGESHITRHSTAQALNFDITFLILTYIVQRYGSELIERDPQSTFNKWYYEYYNKNTCFDCPNEMLKNSNDDVVTSLIKQLIDPNKDVEMNLVNWSDVCFNIPKAICEILNAWTQSQLNESDIAVVIEKLRSKMCFMAVVAANWLQRHIKTLDESRKQKPMHILNSLCKTNQATRAQQQRPSEEIFNSELKKAGYERSSLMSAIIKRIHFDLAPKKASPASNTSNGNKPSELDESQDDTSYHSHKDKFISTLITKEIFIANVKQCLSRGWTDYNSLNSISSLFKIIGSECFTELLVDEILTTHESPSDLARAVNITFGLFHLDIEACAFALLGNVIPAWLMCEKKQLLLNQPRAFALANLAVMTIIEIYSNLISAYADTSVDESNAKNGANSAFDGDKKFIVNGVRSTQLQQQQQHQQQQRNPSVVPMNVDTLEAAATASDSGSVSIGNVSGGTNPNGSRDNVKRIKLMHQSRQDMTAFNGIEKDINFGQTFACSSISDSLDKLNGYLANLMRLFKEIMSDSEISHRTLFPILFLQQTVVCARDSSEMITVHLQPEILLDIVDLFSSELTFELVLAISNLSTTHSRRFTAKSVCKLAQILISNGIGGDHLSKTGRNGIDPITAKGSVGSSTTGSHAATSSLSSSGIGQAQSGGAGGAGGAASSPMMMTMSETTSVGNNN